MDSSEDAEQNEINWSDLSPSIPDKHQDYIFVAHLILAIVISILSFSDGLLSWTNGTGLITPLLLFSTGIAYGVVPGINWYREEFIPHLCRTSMIPEFEADRFLNYRRMYRRSILVSGYLTTAIIQVVWTMITAFGATTDIITIITFLSLFLVLMIVTYLIVLYVWLSIFEYLLKSFFSDVSHILASNENLTAYYQARKEKAKEDGIE